MRATQALTGLTTFAKRSLLDVCQEWSDRAVNKSLFVVGKVVTLCTLGIPIISFFRIIVVSADLTLVNGDEESLYLCGNSLGLCPKRTEHFVNDELRKWQEW